MAHHELSKIDTSSLNEEAKKTIDAAKEELQEGQREVAACQKCIRLADRSEYGWVTVEAYDDDKLAEDQADEKKKADAERRQLGRSQGKGKAKAKPATGVEVVVVTSGGTRWVTKCQQPTPV